MAFVIKFDIKFNILLFSNIEIITEKSTIKPPIIITVEIALLMLLVKIVPMLENAKISLLELLKFLEVYVIDLFLFFFQNLKMNPTVKQESK